MLENISSYEYIEEKSKKNGEYYKTEDGKNKVIIGVGGFGTVKFALSLFESDK